MSAATHLRPTLSALLEVLLFAVFLLASLGIGMTATPQNVEA